MRYLSNVVTLKLDSTKCNGCRMCIQVCPHNVFKMQKGKALIKRLNHCMECGACAKNCEQGAISVKAGVGCAAGILDGLLGNTGGDCCVVESKSSCC